MSGYGHAAYAESFAEIGEPAVLPRSGGWIVKRAIPGLGKRDAMGVYPFLACRDWSALASDLDELRGIVSLVVVTDPFGEYRESDLRAAFPARMVKLRDHHTVTLGRRAQASRHHQYYAERAAAAVTLDLSRTPLDHLDEWTTLYDCLVARHSVRGVRAFSRAAFARQLGTPGMHLFRALVDGETVSAHLWLERGEVAYSHLAASSTRGYRLNASYALYRAAIDYFRGAGVEQLDLGGAPSAGLDRFKRGWANGTRPVYLGGRVYDEAAYARLARGRASAYFPAYREGEA